MNPPPVTLRLQATADGVAPAVRGAAGEIDKLGASAARAQGETRGAAVAAKELAGASGAIKSTANEAAAAIDRQTEALRRQAVAVSASHSAQVAALRGQVSAAEQAQKSRAQERAPQVAKQATDDAYASLRKLHQLTQTVPAAQDKANESQLRGALSAKAYAQQMRVLPMQITDIVTSLASGQPAYMVAIQQGGQLRDGFGGIGNALKALGSLISPAVVLLGGLGLVAGVIAKAISDVQRENTAFVQSIVMTGNASGETTDQLQESARAIDAFVGTRGKAAEVLAQIAATGKVGVGQLQEAAQVAIQLQRSAGISTEQTVKQFAELGDQPTTAVKKLNEQYHFLTASTYAQIRALEEQGNKGEAAALAQSTFSAAMTTRAQEAEKALGTLQKVARGTKDFFKEMWDAVLDVGREKTLQEKIDELNERLHGGGQTAFAVDGGGGPAPPIPKGRERAGILQQVKEIEDQQAWDAAAARWEAAQVAAQTQSIAVEDRLAAEATQSRARAASNEETTRAAQAQARLVAIRRDLAAESAEYGNQQSLLEAQRAAGLVSATAYYQQRRAMVDSLADLQVGALQSENVALRQQTASTIADVNKARAAVDSTRTQGGPDYEAAVRRLDQAQSKALSTRLEAESKIKDNAAEIVRVQKDQIAQGETLALQAQDAPRIDAEAQRARAAPQRYLDSMDAEIRLLGMTDEARARFVRGLQAEQGMREAINEANRNGVNISQKAAAALIAEARATADYSVSAEKAAAQSREWADVWVSAVDRGADAWADFISRGLKDFKKLSSDLKDTAKNLVRDLVKTFLSQKFIKPLQDQLAGLFSGNGFSIGGQNAGGWMKFLTGTAGSIATSTAGAASAASTAAGAGAGAGAGAAASAGTAGATATGALAAVPIAGWIAIGMMANANLYKSGWDPAGQRSDMFKSIMKDTAIAGMLIGGPAGALVGAGMGLVFAGPLAVDSILKKIGVSGKWASILSGSAVITKLFGHKKPEVARQGIEGSYGFEGVDGQAYADIVAKGGIFRKDKKWTEYQALEDEITKGFSAAAKSVKNGAMTLARQMGIDISAQLAAVRVDMGRLELDEDPEIASKQIEQAMSDMSERLSREAVNALGFVGLLDDGFAVTDTMNSLSTALQLAANNVAKTTRVMEYFQQQANDLGTDLATQASRIGEAVSSYGELIGNVGAELLTRSLTDSQRAALEIETTYREQVRQANDLARALGLSGARAEDLAMIEQLRAADMADLTQQIKNQAAGIVNGLSISDYSPLKDSQKLTKSMEELRAAIMQGDVNNAQQLAQSALGFGRNLYASGTDYQDLYGTVTQLLQQMGVPSTDLSDGTTMGDLADILLDLPQQIGTAVIDAMLSPKAQIPSTPPRAVALAAPDPQVTVLLTQILQVLQGDQKERAIKALQDAFG